MPHPHHPSPLNPTPAIRVGVTGTRALDPNQIARLTLEVQELLQCITDAFAGPSQRRLLSPLAEGADRLVAGAAQHGGWQLVAPLPFPQAEYENDFPETVGPFRDLLSHAQVLELDGDRSDANAAYEAAGRFVARNCDLLIAIWNGQPGQGRGGTADIIHFAARSNVPIWWLKPDDAAPAVLLRGAGDLQRPDSAPQGDAARAALAALLQAAITPPDLPPPDRSDLIGRLVGHACRLTGRSEHPLENYLAETARPQRMIWGIYSRFMDIVAPRAPLPPAPEPAAQPAPTPIDTYWQQLGGPADLLSISYGDRYRSCYIVIFALAATALTASGLGLAFPHSLEIPATILEALTLLGILAVVANHHLRRFHERWIACRLLAELCRQQQVLTGLGWSLPHWEVERLSTSHAGPSPRLPRDAWVAWYFAAARRAAPLPQGRLDASTVAESAAAGRTLAHGQIAYHEQRQHRSHLAAARLSDLSQVTFGAALLLVLLKFIPIAFEWDGEIRVISFLTAFLPAVSAAAFGVRAYAEFELLADQSARMRHDLERIAADLATPRPPAPLASQTVGAELLELAMTMLRDTRGWAQLFRMKSVEAG